MRDLKYQVLDVIDDLVRKRKLKSLSPDERNFWAVSYASGVIGNDGLHGYLFWFDKYLTREMAVTAFIDLDLTPIALAIVEAGNLSLDYIESTPEDQLGSRDFRQRYSESLTALEKEI
jgi:hypothetical protein